MKVHISAQKRARQNVKRRLINRSNMSAMKTAIKKVREATNIEQIEVLFRNAQAMIAKTKRKGAIHRNTMARYISRLRLFVNKNIS